MNQNRKRKTSFWHSLDQFTTSMSGGVYLKCEIFTALVQFLESGERNGICCQMIHWHWGWNSVLQANCGTSHSEWECNPNPLRKQTQNTRVYGYMWWPVALSWKAWQMKIEWEQTADWADHDIQFLSSCNNQRPKLTAQNVVYDLLWLSPSTNIFNLEEERLQPCLITELLVSPCFACKLEFTWNCTEWKFISL